MSGIFKRIAATIAALVRSFFGVKKDDSVMRKGIKTFIVGLKWSSYYFIDWGIFWFYGIVVGIMKYYGFLFASIFFSLWLLEIIITSIFLYSYKKTGTDITLGENLRNFWDVLSKKSKVVGIFSLIGLTIKMVFWDGSERTVIFFMKEAYTAKKMVLLTFVVSGTKVLAYALFFSYGYDILGIL